MFRSRSFLTLLAAMALLAAPLSAKSRAVAGHYERAGQNEQASLDVRELPGQRVNVTGIALWNTRNEKYGPNIGELSFEAPIKEDVVSWTDSDGYRIVIRFSRHALDVQEHGVAGHFGMNVTFAGHFTRSSAQPED